MRVVRLAVVALLFAAVLPAPPASAGANRWTTKGPFGGFAGVVEVHPTQPDVVLSGTHGAGVFRSADGGTTWRRSSAGLPVDTLVFDIAYAASQPSVVYIATYTGGVFKSTDGGLSWRHTGGLEGGTIVTVAVRDDDANEVFASSGSETWKSSNGGATWTELRRSTGESVWANELLAPPGDVVYAAGPDFLVSRDAGTTWTDGASPPHVQVVVTDPNNADRVFIGSGDGIHRSVDGGRTFTQVMQVPVLDSIESLTFHHANPKVIFAGAYISRVYRSVDGGATWSPWRTGLPAGERAFVASAGRGALVGMAHHGVYRRTSSDHPWRASRKGLVAPHIGAVVVPPSGGSTVYAGTQRQGVMRSDDSGSSWRAAGLFGRIVAALAVHPRNAAVVYAATDAGVYRSNDGGRSWRRKLHVPGQGVTDVEISRSSPSTVYASTFEGGVFRSSDGGSTWRKTTFAGYQVAFSLAVHPTAARVIYVGTRFSGILRSNDGGRTWRAGAGAPTQRDVRDIEIDRSTPRRVYAAVEGAGIYRSGDGGGRWGHLPAPISDAWTVTLDTRRPGVVYAGGILRGSGVYRTTDAGRSWTALRSGLTTTWITDLALHPSGRMLHAGTTAYGIESGGGVFSYRFE